MLDVERLVRSYGPVRALDGMTFAVRPGTVTGFLGPNGAGKTTTMRAIFGLTALDDGVVNWNDTPVDGATRRRFGYLPEERGLYPTMRVLDQLVFLGRLRGLATDTARTRATDWLARLGLGDRDRSTIEELSLGNQQRVQLIGALLHEPDVLVLDEPFSGLDPVAVDALSRVLVDEARRGATVLFSSHQLDLVESLCEDAVIVDRGKVIAQGSLDELTAGASPVLAIEVAGESTNAWTAGLDPQHFQLIANAGGTVRLSVEPGDTDPTAVAQLALDVARAAGPIRSFGFERRTLAEVFLELVAAAGAPRDASEVTAAGIGLAGTDGKDRS